MYIERKLETTILRYLKDREILAIVGPRQSGKTTMLQKIQSSLDKSIFLTFEDAETLNLFEEDIKKFARVYGEYRYIFIDEFQYSKTGGKKLKFLFDLYPNLKIIISGSSAIDLTIRAIKFLTGRVFVFNLYQLDFEEFLSFKDNDLLKIYQKFKNDFDPLVGRFTLPPVPNASLAVALDEFIVWGGYPRVVRAKSAEDKRLVLKNIYNTYFLRDIKDILGLADDFRLSKLIKALAVQIGQLVEYNELRTLSDYDYLSLKKYLNILEKTFICQIVRPFFRNKRTEIVKNPKIYFFDTGLRNHVVGDFADLGGRDDRGFLYENFIFNELTKREKQLNYWRTKNGAEVDFVVSAGDKLIPLESKSTLNEMRLSSSFRSFINQYHPELSLVFNSNFVGKMAVENSVVYFAPHYLL